LEDDRATQLIADGTENRAGAAAVVGVHVKTLRRALRGPDDLAGSPAREKPPASVRTGNRV
jgi:hypothetical protein